MKNYFLLLLILITVFCCRNIEKEKTETKNQKIETVIKNEVTKNQIELTEIINTKSLKSENNKVVDWKHPGYFEFKNYKEYQVSDTISIDLNGNGTLERIYFDRKDCSKLIIEEKGKDLISIGCGKEEYKGFPKAIGWVNLWCVVSDKKTIEVIVKDGELLEDKIVSLEQPSIYLGKEEAGGGIITYRNGELYWIHQSD